MAHTCDVWGKEDALRDLPSSWGANLCMQDVRSDILHQDAQRCDVRPKLWLRS